MSFLRQYNLSNGTILYLQGYPDWHNIGPIRLKSWTRDPAPGITLLCDKQHNGVSQRTADLATRSLRHVSLVVNKSKITINTTASIKSMDEGIALVEGVVHALNEYFAKRDLVARRDVVVEEPREVKVARRKAEKAAARDRRYVNRH